MAIITTKIITPTQNVIITPANATIFVTSVERRELVDGDQVSYYDFSATINGQVIPLGSVSGDETVRASTTEALETAIIAGIEAEDESIDLTVPVAEEE